MSFANGHLPRSRRIEVAERHLKRAREILAENGAAGATLAIRHVLKRAEGARRHAAKIEARLLLEARQEMMARDEEVGPLLFGTLADFERRHLVLARA